MKYKIVKNKSFTPHLFYNKIEKIYPFSSRKGEGFTLIEVLVAVAIFALVISIAIGIFIMGFRSQKRILATQQVLDETSYVMEYMSRAVRMAKRAEDANCIPDGTNYQRTYTGHGLKFINYQGVCQEFYWNQSSNQLVEKKDEGATIALTSNNLEVKEFNVITKGEEGPLADTDQPKITLFLEIRHKKQSVGLQIQTTISQRNLDM